MGKKLTTEKFIEKARQVHNDLSDFKQWLESDELVLNNILE